MGSGYSDGIFVVAHDLTEQFGSVHVRDAFTDNSLEFRIVRMDCSSIDDQINIVGDVFSFLSIDDRRAMMFKFFSNRRGFHIRTGDGKTAFKKDLCQTAHADAANTHKMDFYRTVKVNFIHIK